MKVSIAICTLVFMLMIQETTSFSMREKKVIEFEREIKAMGAASTPVLQATTKQDGRVIYPIGYGADPSGIEESSDAILNALSDALKLGNRSESLLPGIKDLGGIVIDLQGGNFKISKPITFPSSAGNLVVKGGTLRASDTFPGDRHLIELWSSNSQPFEQVDTQIDPHNLANIKQEIFNSGNMNYESITFRDILFDSSYRGGGIFIIDSARIRIDHCFFLHFTTQGILVERGHETFVSSCFLGQHSTVGQDRGEKDFSGTGIDLKGNDNGITNVVIFSAAIGIQITGQANLVTGAHCYNKATSFGGIGISVKMGAALTRLDSCYLDFTAIIIEEPLQVHVTNGLFIGDANIVLKSIRGKVYGVNIVDNMFNGNPNKMNSIVTLDGDFTTIDQVVIDRNNAEGMTIKSTAAKLTVSGNGNGTKWVADFSPMLIFPNRIKNYQYSLYVQDAVARGFVMHAVTTVSNNAVVVQSDKAVNGVVCVAVDQ